ncbi:MAG: Fic family protein [Nitrospira sp.]|nr:Fic family protein [Nitrospira sp.]
MAKGNTFFGPSDYVDAEMSRRFDLLAKEHHLQGLTKHDFPRRAAEHLNEISAIHPFREGNGRTQRLFLKALATQAGHELHAECLHPAPWNEASIKGFAGNHGPMEQVIHSALASRVQTGTQDRGRGRERD